MMNSKETWAGICAVAAAVLFLIASFWQTDAEVYLFPRIIALLMGVLASFQAIGTMRSGATTGDELNIPWAGMLPGLVLVVIFVLVIETTGFYIGSLVAFLGIVSIYGKRSITDPKALLRKVIVASLFMAVLYGLFWKLLYVRTPTGWLF